MKKLLIIFSVFLLAVTVSAQKTHTVAKGDNPYNIAKKYGMSLEDLFKLNPQVKDGKIAIGQVLTINKKQTPAPKPATPVVVSPKTGKIILQPKQTIYGITKQYHISEAELRKLNPDLDNHMKIGDEVILPAENIKKYADKNAFQQLKQETPLNTVDEEIKPTPTTPANDYFYTVQPKDNYYKITKNYNLTQEQLFSLNPGLEEKGLKPGDVIRIKGDVKETVKEQITTYAPAPETPKPSRTSQTSDDYQTYTVQQGDTVFGILNKFNITLDQLLELNPALKNGLQQGMVLKIKKIDTNYIKKNDDGILNVVIMLPFGFDAGDAKFRNLSLDFLTGAKLAVERNVENGQLIDLKIVDAGSESSFKNSLSQINQNNTDLIIGPFFKSNLLQVLDYVKDQKIPVVAPFANSEDLYDYNNLIIVETNENVYSERIAKEVSQVYSDQKIYILADENRAKANALQQKIEALVKNPNVSIVKSALDIQLDQNMMTGQKAPVIAILATDNDALGNEFTSRISALARETQGIKSFSMYYHPSFEKKVDELSQANLVYLMDRKINADGSFEKEILSDYKKKYCKTPSKYAIVGFDVVNDILSRENRRGEVFKQINKVQTQLATKFEYVRIKPNGAYVNNGYRVVRLVPEN